MNVVIKRSKNKKGALGWAKNFLETTHHLSIQILKSLDGSNTYQLVPLKHVEDDNRIKEIVEDYKKLFYNNHGKGIAKWFLHVY